MPMDLKDFKNFKESSIVYNIVIGDVIHVTPPNTADSYNKLRFTDDDRTKTREIIETLAKYGYYDLLVHYRNRLEKIGEEVRPVHPLKFLGYVFSDPTLKKCMCDIFSDFMKRYNFMGGLSPRFEVENSKGTLKKFYVDFAKEVKVNPDAIKPYLDKKEWTGFMYYLIEH